LGSRPYFYKDESKNTQQYVYCLHCLAGPFKQDELNKKFLEFGNKHATYYCIKCARIIGIGDPPSATRTDIEPVVPNAVEKSDELFKPENLINNLEPISNRPDDTPTPELADGIASPKPKKTKSSEHNPITTHLQEVLRSKKSIPTEEPYFIYIAQCADDSFFCGVTTNLTSESARINRGELSKVKSLPADIVYFKTEKRKEDAMKVRVLLSKYKKEQKTRLADVFSKQFFST
jgi:predicted GIY-YIG superfamily endonuclease